ncbi:MAG: hypothetical protein MJZ57_01845 [Bacteroidales bacterium]|nr:hypothetical protein [Bacteroidales bacterium]
MKTNAYITLAILLLTSLLANGQSWIGSQFDLDTTIRIDETNIPENLSLLKCNVCEGSFYYIDAKAFQDKSKGYQALLYAVSLNDYMQTVFTLSLPHSSLDAENLVRTFWITDFWITGDTLTISVQDNVLIYHKNEINQFEYDTLYAHPNIKNNYMHLGELYFFEEDHDFGYHWFRVNLANGKEELIRDLPYEVPHVVQANPNRYLFRDEQYVYFLSTRKPLLKKYALDGTWIEDVSFPLPHWHPFEDEYIQQSMSVPYGIERIHATMNDIFRYSYPKVVFPIGGDYLMYYTQFDTVSHRSTLKYAILDSARNASIYSARDNTDSAYTVHRFPFNLYDLTADKARISWNDRLIELVLDDTIHWTGLKPGEYRILQEKFFRQHDPVPSIRIMTYRNSHPVTQPFFQNAAQQYLSLANLPVGKNILLINNELECSACRNSLLTILNDVDSTVNIGILYPFIPGALQEHELSKELKRYLRRPFELYYSNPRRYAHYPRYIFKLCNSFPSILFYESGKAPILFSLDNIYEEDPITLRFTEEFREVWSEFISK